MESVNLPFKAGQLAEARSFESGYRGAWFRCKIREISKRKGELGHVSEYYDFPDEKLKWTKLYNLPPHYVEKQKEKQRELMLRPCYPPVYNEKQMPHVSEISEVIVIVDNSWKVGDLVDWWTTDCYWSGSITRLLGDDKAQIGLEPPPVGEGSFYEVFLKDVRPSLDWSPDHGWTIPTQEGDAGCPCARLIKPINHVIGRILVEDGHNASGQETDAAHGSAGSPARLSYSCPVSSNSEEMQKRSMGKNVSKELKDEKEKSTSHGCGNSSKRKTSWADTDSGQNSAEPASEEKLRCDHSQKYSANEGIVLNSTRSDTLEAAIMDLEEYVNKVKWLKKILQDGITSFDAQRPEWESVEPHAAPEIPK